MRFPWIFLVFFVISLGAYAENPLYWGVANNDALEVWKDFGAEGSPGDLEFDPKAWAVDRGSAEVLDVLRWKGAKLDGIDERGRNLLFGAAALGRLDIFRKILADGARVEQVDQHGWTLAHAAAPSPHPEMLKYILWAGVDPTGKNSLGVTPIMVACGAGKPDAVEMLLAWGAVPEDEDFLGRSVRDYAVAGGDPKTLGLIDGALIPWTIGPAGEVPPP